MASRVGICAAVILGLFVYPFRASADKLVILSTPPGASVEIDGVPVGTTPVEKDFPGGYFHRTLTVFGARLEHPMIARISLPGYATKEIQLTVGPMERHSLNGRSQGEYWVIRARQFSVVLDSISDTFTGEIHAKTAAERGEAAAPEMSLAALTQKTKPAVVYLKGLDRAGTGFFVNDRGLIATNAHLARGENTLLARLPNGIQLEARVVYIDPDLDIALAKVNGSGFPHLDLADAAAVQQGETVLAVGNPGDAMLFSFTKGIVSAVGPFPGAGPGTWIQTDAPINPGNSGGPLLNLQGDVIGINTQKLVKKNVNGIGFALSASDLLTVLRRFYPPEDKTQDRIPAENAAAANAGLKQMAAPVSDTATVEVSSDATAADIYVDHQFAGNTPSSLELAAGRHLIVVRAAGHADWMHILQIDGGSKLTLRAIFAQTSPASPQR